MFICPNDGRHFRGFITDQKYVKSVLDTADSVVMKATTDGKGNGSGEGEEGVSVQV